MNYLVKTEKALFYFLSFAGFWQLRLVWTPVGQQFNEWTSFYLYATDLIIVAILFLWGARDFRLVKPMAGFKLKWLIPKSAADWLWLFLFICLLSIFFSQDCWLGFYRLAKLLEFAGLYFYIRYNFTNLFNWQKFWQFFIAGAALQSIVATAQFLTQKSLGLKFFAESPLSPNIDGVAKLVVGGVKIVRAYGLVPHPNILAAILMVAIFGIAWLWLERKEDCHSDPPAGGEESPANAGELPAYAGDPSACGLGMTKRRDTVIKIIFILVFILFSSALFFTFSRSVMVIGYAFFIAWLVYLFWRRKESRRAIILIAVLLFIVNCLLLTVYRPYVSSRYDLAAIGDSQSMVLRQFYNQSALDFVEISPLLGIGLGNFVKVLADMYNKLQPWVWQPAHNIYLLIAAETGLAGLLAFLAFLFLTIKSAWHRRSNLEISYLLFAIGYLLIIGLFDHFLWDIQQGQILFWLALGLLSSFRHSERSEESSSWS